MALINHRTTSVPGKWEFWMGERILHHDYNIDRQSHYLQLENGDVVEVTDAYLRNHDPNNAPTRTHGVPGKEVKELEERYKKIIEDITNAFKKREEEHERERTQDKKRNEYLQHQVLVLERKLQGRDESYSGGAFIGGGRHVYRFVDPTGPVPDFPGDSTGSKVPSSGSYSSSNRSTTADDSV